ncbi:coenzyme F420-0:L-glutamate ligase [Micromonospora sp. C51]|uniref:coenzyme F420-0:L-glutamate ligase n=1 Tax=Micromonospora sp. C51 TaxID=2824879 RepID=UPI001B36C2D8|nr:coenzyme F420-0:L-glutamate ligase [Micromonospora sp. C51]MBQ1050164.1 coenzyme F420-0:L-glutamate ligase [Micromonospora sp. C51]
MRLEILPVPGIGHVTEGDDLAVLIGSAAPWLRDGDVLVVTSKIISKAEGRLVDVPADGPDRQAVRDDVLAAETVRVVASRGPTRIVQTRHGFVMAAAGIDASNVDKTRLVLLPEDPDASARALRAGLRARYGVDVAVVVSDTMGRPWRNGLTDVALGVAGMDAIRDHRGEVDPYGNELVLTQMAVIDELAAAGELIKGKCDQMPVAVIRGYLTPPLSGDGEGARVLVRDASMDLFSLGTAEAKAAGLTAAATLPDQPGDAAPDAATVERAIASVADVIAPGTVFTQVTDDEVRAALIPIVPGWPAHATGLVLCSPPTPVGPFQLVRFGTDVQRLRTALAAANVPTQLLPPPNGTAAATTLAL